MHQSLFKQKPKMFQYKKSCPSLKNQMLVYWKFIWIWTWTLDRWRTVGSSKFPPFIFYFFVILHLQRDWRISIGFIFNPFQVSLGNISILCDPAHWIPLLLNYPLPLGLSREVVFVTYPSQILPNESPFQVQLLSPLTDCLLFLIDNWFVTI